MEIKYRPPNHNGEPITLSIPVGSEVEIHLYPGDIPTIDPHEFPRVNKDVRSFDVSICKNGDLVCDWVNVTKISNGEIELKDKTVNPSSAILAGA